jgi:hypothetical protein
MQPWALFIDIEGFSKNYKNNHQPLLWLGALMKGIYLIGTESYPSDTHRIFAYQFGDGFLISGLYGLPYLKQPLSIAIALMRYVLCSGGTAKAAISEGDVADIASCYPENIQQEYRKSEGRPFNLGSGLMIIQPVNGEGLINTYQLLRAEMAPSGSLLLVSASDLEWLPENTLTTQFGNLFAVDWLHADFPELQYLLEHANLALPNLSELESKIQNYTAACGMDSWTKNTLSGLHL